MEKEFASESESGRTRETYIKRLLKDIQLDDSAIQVVGYAKSVNPSQEFYIDDKEGKIHVRDIPDEIENIQEGSLYRVFGELSIDGSGTQYISAHIVQDMEKLNFELYIKSMELVKKII